MNTEYRVEGIQSEYNGTIALLYRIDALLKQGNTLRNNQDLDGWASIQETILAEIYPLLNLEERDAIKKMRYHCIAISLDYRDPINIIEVEGIPRLLCYGKYYEVLNEFEWELRDLMQKHDMYVREKESSRLAMTKMG